MKETDGGETPAAPPEPIPGSRGRRVALLAVHHVDIDGTIYTGGAEKYIQTVTRALLNAGASVHVGYSGTSIYDEILDEYEPHQLTVERTGWLNDVLSGDRHLRLGVLTARRKWLRAVGADTVFAVQQAGGGAFGVSLLAARLLGLRVVSSLRQLPQSVPAKEKKHWLGLVPSPQLWRRRIIWRRRLPALCCHRLIYNSRIAAEAYRREYGFPSARACVIPNGELPRTRPSARSNPYRIGAVGRITEAKGAGVLLDAFSIVAESRPDATLTYFGDGALIRPLEARVRERGLQDRVRFAGYLPDRDRIYSAIDICVQASQRESMSNSVIEAQSYGIPCVVTRVGGMPEAIEDDGSGSIVPIDDPPACARAIEALLEDRDLYARFSDAASERSARLFDIRRLMRQTVKTILGL